MFEFLLSVLVVTSSPVAPAPLPLDVLTYQFLDPATGALCLDGSPGGYAGRNGSKTQLVLYLPGGGWCESKAECAGRALTSLGSSTVLTRRGNTTVAQGEMSANATLNPHFYTWTHVEPIYCDGSNFAGVLDHTGMPGAAYSGTLHVRGRQVLTSVLDVILDDWGQSSTHYSLIKMAHLASRFEMWFCYEYSFLSDPCTFAAGGKTSRIQFNPI